MPSSSSRSFTISRARSAIWLLCSLHIDTIIVRISCMPSLCFSTSILSLVHSVLFSLQVRRAGTCMKIRTCTSLFGRRIDIPPSLGLDSSLSRIILTAPCLAQISPLVGIHLFGVLLASSWFSEPRLLTCSQARPQPIVWIAPPCAQISVRGCRAIRALPQPLVRRAQAGAQSPARNCRAPRARSQPLVRRAPAHASSARVSVAAAASACCLCVATSLPLQLPPLAACVPPRLRGCSCRSLPVRRRFSADAAASAPFSAICALRAVCFTLRYL